MFSLSSKVAVVSGGSRGIGRAIAEALARSGAHVVLTYRSDGDAAESAVAGIEREGGHAEAVRLDVRDSKLADGVLMDVARRLGRLDILVCNTGVTSNSLLLELTEAELDDVLAVNLKGAVYCAKSAVKTMLRARRGRIVLVSSVAGQTGNPGQAAYAASKAALIGLGKSLARELAVRGITVNVVSPGLIETDMTAGLAEEQRHGMLAGIPVRRSGRPDEVAAAVVYLASDEAAYVTGHTLSVNGGMHM
jgi:3-oxoacyl-[acyl-carrier protein] reductase